MAQNYVVMARKNLLKPSEAPKYYAVARSGRKVTVKEVCKRITERSSYSKGELEGCIGEFLLEIVNVLDEGNIVQMGDLGNFRMSLKTATATATEKEFKASCVSRKVKCFSIREVISASCVKHWTLHCIRVTVSPIRETNRCRTMVRAISPAVVQVTMAMKLRTRLFNQSLFTIKD